MKLALQTFAPQVLKDHIDTRGDDQHRPLFALCEEVSHWTIQRPGHAHPLAFARDQGKGPLQLEHGLRRLRPQHASCVVGRHRIQLRLPWLQEIDYAFNVLVQAILFPTEFNAILIV